MKRERRDYGKFDFTFSVRNRTAEGQTDRQWIGVTWDGQPFPGEGQPFPVLIRVGVWADGTLACTGLKLGLPFDEEHRTDWRVTAGNLRKVPLEQILVQLAAQYRQLGFDCFPAGLQRDHMEPFVAPKPHPGFGGYGDDFYADVARRYLEARKVYPRGTFGALTRELNAASGETRAEGTVRRWVNEGLWVLKARGKLSPDFNLKEHK